MVRRQAPAESHADEDADDDNGEDAEGGCERAEIV
jgi:hypothetical protein